MCTDALTVTMTVSIASTSVGLSEPLDQIY